MMGLIMMTRNPNEVGAANWSSDTNVETVEQISLKLLDCMKSVMDRVFRSRKVYIIPFDFMRTVLVAPCT